MPPVIPDYELLRPIGRGAYGEVWLARSVTGIYRAAKIVQRASFTEARPFEREFGGIQRFEPVSRSQENQIAVLHVGRNEAEGYFYYVMELADDAETETEIFPEKYVPKTLREMRTRQHRLPPKECVTIGIALTRALAHLHGHGLVHRDIKPSNVVFVHGVPKLADIGLVSAVDTSLSFVGTEGFVPPEGPGSVAADLYSLGKVLYEISTGRDRTEFPKLPDDLDGLADKRALLEMNEVVLKACEPRPELRYASAQAMHDDLLLIQAGKSVKRLHLVERRFKLVAKYGLAATAFTLVAAGAFLWATVQARIAKENFALSERHRLAAERALYESELNRARARRMTGRAGQRFETLELFRTMAVGTNRLVLRNEAIASLALPDLRLAKQWAKRRDRTVWLFDAHLRRYFTNDASGNIVIRDGETDRELATLPGGGVPLTAMIGSRDDRFLAASDESGRAAIWNIETRKAVAVDFPEGAALASFTPDGNALMVRRADGSLHFHNSNSGAEESIWRESSASGWISFNMSGSAFLGAVEKDITIYESRDRTLRQKLSHPDNIQATAWHPDGRRLASACGKTIFFWDTATGRELGVAEGHDSRVVGLAFDDSGQVLASVGWDGTTRLWQSETRRELVRSSQAGSGLALSPDGRRLAFQSWDETRVELWEIASGRELRRFELPASERRIYLTTYHGGFSRDATLLHLDGYDGTHLFDAHSLQPLALLPSAHPVGAGVFHPAGTSFIQGTGTGLFRWPIESAGAGAPLRVGPPQPLPYSRARTKHGVSLNADGRFLVTNDREDVWVINLPDATTVLQSRSRVSLGASPAISADGRWVAIGSPPGGDDSLQIWDTRNGKVATKLHLGGASLAHFSPDNRWLLSATPAEYRYWETGSWKPGIRLKRSASNTAWGGDFSPDGKLVALGVAEHRIQLFAAGTAHELAALPAGHLVVKVTFSPDGTQLLVTYEAGVAELWDLRLIREELAGLKLDWDSPTFAPVAGPPKDWPYRRPISMIVVTNESVTRF